MRSKSGVWIVSTQIGRGDHELEALGICSRSSVANVHITAADPFCPGGHANLIAGTIIAYDGSHSVGSMSVIVARSGRICTANSAAGMDGVEPVIVVIRRGSVPSAIL